MVGNRYVTELVRLLQTKQVLPSQLLANTGLDWDKVLSGEQLVRKHHMRTLVANSLEHVAEPDLGLQFGQRLNANTHGILGFALMNCATLNELMQVWLKFHSINHSELQLNYRVEDGMACLEARLTGDQSSAIFSKEVLFASVYTTLSFLLNESPDWAELWFDYPPPDYAEKYSEVFHKAAEFNKPQCQLRAPIALLEKPVSSANPEAAKIYQQRCEEMLRTMTRRDGLAKKVQKLLLESSGEFPRIGDLAADLHMSERTLRRKLTAEGTSFQEVFNDVRFRLAGEYLESTGLGVADIAHLLGFADPSNFRRAFIQWANMSPAQYRKSHLALLQAKVPHTQQLPD